MYFYNSPSITITDMKCLYLIRIKKYTMNTLKKIIALVVLLVLVVGGYMIYGTFINPKSPKGVVNYEKEDVKIEVVYHRPFKKERLIFGAKEDKALVPFGEYWRLGANAATTFETSQDIPFAGRMLKAGTYRMYAIPEADHWFVALNEEAGKFGYNEPDYSKDVMRVNVTAAKLLTPVEQFTIDIQEDGENITLRMRWDTTSVAIPLN